MDKTQPSLLNWRSLHQMATFSAVFFLIVLLFSTLFIIPTINQSFQSQHDRDLQQGLKLESELFLRFVTSQRMILEDLAKFPSLTNAVMLSDSNNRNVNDLFDNILLGGAKGRLVLQDIGEKVLLQTSTDLIASYQVGQEWTKRILEGSIPFHFQLLAQQRDAFTFQISVPIMYNSYVEGVLSAEITLPLTHVFAAHSLSSNVAFKLTQKYVTIYTESGHIEQPREQTINLDNPDIRFTYITDYSQVKAEERLLRNTILSVLFGGLAISFSLFATIAYRSAVVKNETDTAHLTYSTVYLIPILIGLIGVAASIAAYVLVLDLQEQAFEKELSSNNREKMHSLRHNINSRLEILDAVKALYQSHDEVNRQTFSSFVEPLLAKQSNVLAIEWVPNITHAQRAEFEKRGRLEGLDNFSIKQKNDQGDIVIAPMRNLYYPIYFAETAANNEIVMGFDLGSDSEHLATVIEAQDRGKKVATGPISLALETGAQTGMLVFSPIYEKLYATRQLAGFIVLVLRIGELVEDTLGLQQNRGTVFIQDVSDFSHPQTIFGQVMAKNKYTYTEEIKVAGRVWSITTYPPASKATLIWIPRSVLTIGLLFSLIIMMGLIHLIRRREIVEHLVKERTKEIRMLSSAVANANDMFIITDANHIDLDKGGPNIVYVNQSFVRNTGFSFKDAVGSTPRILQGEKTDKAQLKRIRQALEKGESYSGELINYCKDGSPYWVNINIAPIFNEKHQITHFASVQRDITAYKNSQVEREKLINNLSDSNEELARFAYVCSHDLQEPLRMIRSFSEKLATHMGDTLEQDEKGKKYFRFVIDGATRAQALITDILAYSSISNDTQKLQETRIEEIVNNIQDNLLGSFENSKGLISYDELPTLIGNKTQLMQLFQNIINNGLKYQKTNVTPHVHIHAKDHGQYWLFSINDNGIGMEQHHLNKIFDVFQRLHRKSQYAGTGVGLSICKKVVERHGGTIWVESEKGVGSTFYFTLLKPTQIEKTHEQ